MSRAHTSPLVALALLVLFPSCLRSQSLPPNPPAGDLLFSDDFSHGLANWTTELEAGGSVTATSGTLTIDVPAGASVWFKPLLTGPVVIKYDATVINNGGPNDRVSDLNCFWMARDARSPANIFGWKRSGTFADYNQLLTYYVGVGGNTNTTTRFRRYVGDPIGRPLRPGDDLQDAADLLVPNKPQQILLVANGNVIQFYRDKKKLFEMNDPKPYTSGWFAFRTTHSHLAITNFCIYKLPKAAAAAAP